jgi:rubrerythrin
MKDMTRANIAAAFAGESQAHMKYSIYADRAEREGYAQVAKLFRAIAYAEKVHATNHLRVLDGVHTTAENLTAAAGGENYEVHEMYPAFNVVAELQDEKAAIRSIHYALEAEIIHEDLYKQAKEFVDCGKDLNAAVIYVCPVCGHTAIGTMPEKCPVCGLAQDKYKTF